MGHKKRNRRPTFASKDDVDFLKLLNSTAIPQQRRHQVRFYLESLSSKEILDLFVIRISDIEDHYSSTVKVSRQLAKALSFAEANGSSWKIWQCFLCKDKFADLESHKHHMRPNLPKFPTDWESISPRRVRAEWVKIIVAGGLSWEPIDVPFALNLIRRHPQQCRPELSPLSDDPERIKLLQRIHIMFRKLLDSNALCASHTDYTLQFAMREAAKKIPSCFIQYMLKKQGHKQQQQPSLFIRFLGANQLRKILEFLQGLSESCVSGCFFSDDSVRNKLLVDGVSLVRDSTKLVLDSHRFYRQSNNVVADASVPACEGRGVPDTEAVVSWLYGGDSVEVCSSLWYDHLRGRVRKCSAITVLLEDKFKLLRDMIIERRDRLNYWNYLQTLKCICLKEPEKDDNELETMSQRLEAMADAIPIINRMVQFGSDDQDSIIEDSLDQLDEGRRIAAGFYQLDDAAIIELAKIDAMIMSNVGCIEDLQLQFELASAVDYLIVVVPLVKNFLRLSIEHEAEKFAEAAGKPFLAELENDDLNWEDYPLQG